MSRQSPFFFCLLLLFFTRVSIAAEVDAPLLVLDHQQVVSLTQYFSLLEDSSSQMTLDDVRLADSKDQFTPSKSNAESLIYGFTPSA